MTSFGAKTTADQVAQALQAEITGKNVLITGVSPDSLGAQAALAIAKQGAANLILAGRSASKLDQTEALIKEAGSTTKLHKVILDLSSYSGVREGAKQILMFPEHIDVLFNNAALVSETYQRTVDGNELGFGTNFLGHFLLVNLILEKLQAAKAPRIINTSSAAIHRADVQYNDPNFTHSKYDAAVAYAQTKTAATLYTVALADKYPHIVSFSFHPGVIYTPGAKQLLSFDSMKDAGFLDENGNRVNPDIWKTAEQGAATFIVAGFDQTIATESGSYLVDCKLANDQAPSYALDKGNATKLWTIAEDLTGENIRA